MIRIKPHNTTYYNSDIVDAVLINIREVVREVVDDIINKATELMLSNHSIDDIFADRIMEKDICGEKYLIVNYSDKLRKIFRGLMRLCQDTDCLTKLLFIYDYYKLVKIPVRLTTGRMVNDVIVDITLPIKVYECGGYVILSIARGYPIMPMTMTEIADIVIFGINTDNGGLTVILPPTSRNEPVPPYTLRYVLRSGKPITLPIDTDINIIVDNLVVKCDDKNGKLIASVMPLNIIWNAIETTPVEEKYCGYFEICEFNTDNVINGVYRIQGDLHIAILGKPVKSLITRKFAEALLNRDVNLYGILNHYNKLRGLMRLGENIMKVAGIYDDVVNTIQYGNVMEMDDEGDLNILYYETEEKGKNIVVKMVRFVSYSDRVGFLDYIVSSIPRDDGDIDVKKILKEGNKKTLIRLVSAEYGIGIVLSEELENKILEAMKFGKRTIGVGRHLIEVDKAFVVPFGVADIIVLKLPATIEAGHPEHGYSKITIESDDEKFAVVMPTTFNERLFNRRYYMEKAKKKLNIPNRSLLEFLKK